jgi:peptide-methionine (R)-S-oxide reductase
MHPEQISHTEAEWKALLTPEEYHVLRLKGTEPAFENAFWDNHEAGTYHCKACGQELYSSDAKFDSGTGWPSFSAPLDEDRVEITGDDSHGMARDEVVCTRCESHLGHVFPDGPAPDGLRYCMNSVCLDFRQE